MYHLDDAKALIGLARETIFLSFKDKKPDLSKYSKYNTKQGVFVTLHKNKELRGCIGYPVPVYPLNEAIVKASIAASFDDPRFNPLDKKELEEIRIELSILTIPKLIEVKNPKDYPKHITIGKDGLIIEKPYTSGLLLPQVAPEWGWNETGLLENTCLKAGLTKNEWTAPDTKIYKFQAQIFAEEKNKIVEK